MRSYVVFGHENEHPLAWMLDRKFRHVWCIIADERAGQWVSYNWHQGLPIVQAEAALTFNIANHYRKDGYTVVETQHTPLPVSGPFVLNNCVGHVKSVLGIQSMSLTPYQLFHWVTRKPESATTTGSRLTIPGFGSNNSQPAPPPPPAPVQAPQSEMAKRAELRLSEADQKRLKLGKFKESASGTLLDDDDGDSQGVLQ